MFPELLEEKQAKRIIDPASNSGDAFPHLNSLFLERPIPKKCNPSLI